MIWIQPGVWSLTFSLLNVLLLFIIGINFKQYWFKLLKNENEINQHCYSWTGFITSKIACCGQGPNNGLGLCTVASNLCPNRDQYAFWDQFHPSEKANKIIVQQILSGSNEMMYPMNLSTVLALDSRTMT